MSEKRKPEDIWNVERILYAYIYDSDEDGSLPDVENMKKSSYKIGHQRFYAALRAYGKMPEYFYKSENARLWPSNSNDICRGLLSSTRSNVKMSEFRELVKKYLKRTPRYDYIVQAVDSPDFLKSDAEVSIVFSKLMEYRKKLYAIQDIWSGMMECSRSVGTVYEVTEDLTREYVGPLCQVLDRMLVLLMGDDYDKSFMVEDLVQFGYPDVTDKEFNRMISEEW